MKCLNNSYKYKAYKLVVPQSPAVLSGVDCQVLTAFGLSPDKWDNLNVLLTMYNRVEASDVFSIQVSKPGMVLSRSYILEQVEHLLMNSAKKEGGKGSNLLLRWVIYSPYHMYYYRTMILSFNSYNPPLRRWQEEHWGLVFPRWLHHL